MIIFQTVFIISGQLIFKQYFIINDDGIKWQRTPLYDKKNLLWHHIKSIKVDYSIINFQLNNRCVKTSLSGLSKQKINELNEVLKKECKEKGISFETKWKEV